jgi:hypothetical protein
MGLQTWTKQTASGGGPDRSSAYREQNPGNLNSIGVDD